MEHEKNKGMEDLLEDIAEGIGYNKENRRKRARPSGVSIVSLRKHLLLWGVSVLVLSGLLAVFFSGNGSSKKEIALMKSRLDSIEQRLVSLEELGNRLDTLDSQQRRYKASVGELRGLIKRQEKKTTELSKNLADLEQTSSSPSQKKAPAAGLHHTISRGETLYGIARRYDMSLDELLDLNGIDKSYVLQPGQKLLVAPVNR